MKALPRLTWVWMLLSACQAHAQAPAQRQPGTLPDIVTYIVLAIMALVMIGLIVSILIVLRWLFRLFLRTRRGRAAQQNDDLDEAAAQVILCVTARAATDWGSDKDDARDSGCPDTVPDSSSDFSGDGGTFDGGGASGDWDD
jgi:uncharacterized protein